MSAISLVLSFFNFLFDFSSELGDVELEKMQKARIIADSERALEADKRCASNLRRDAFRSIEENWQKGNKTKFEYDERVAAKKKANVDYQKQMYEIEMQNLSEVEEQLKLFRKRNACLRSQMHGEGRIGRFLEKFEDLKRKVDAKFWRQINKLPIDESFNDELESEVTDRNEKLKDLISRSQEALEEGGIVND